MMEVFLHSFRMYPEKNRDNQFNRNLHPAGMNNDEIRNEFYKFVNANKLDNLNKEL